MEKTKETPVNGVKEVAAVTESKKLTLTEEESTNLNRIFNKIRSQFTATREENVAFLNLEDKMWRVLKQ